MLKLGDKKGLELAVSTIILIILGLLILIALILLFTRSSSTFIEKVNTYLGSSNVDSLIANCNNLVEQDLRFEYCCTNKTAKISSAKSLQVSCYNASLESWGKEIKRMSCEGVC